MFVRSLSLKLFITEPSNSKNCNITKKLVLTDGLTFCKESRFSKANVTAQKALKWANGSIELP